MRIRRGGFTHRLLNRLAARVVSSERAHAMLEEALGHAYEGLLITDVDGIILKTNEAYARFLGLRQDEMIGRHVTEVVENTRMHIVAKTGVPEIAQLQKIRGHEMICHRIPIFEGGRIVAVVGKVMFRDVDDLFTMTGRFAALKKELEFYKNELHRRGGAKYSFSQIVGTSAALERAKALARKVARSDTTVLLKGESGTGKELFAHAIHLESGRALGPFVKVNCAAIPESLFESELFGYKAGSFTGAQRGGKKGKFALADKGTLLLDEVSELPLAMQVKLLRVLQEREIEPVGAVEPEPIDVRIVAATNKDLEALIAEGAFRQDLYYRLNVLKLEIPPLHERREDIPLLVEALLRGLEKETGIPVDGVDAEAASSLQAYRWPGNVRELRNALEQALYVKGGRAISRADLPRAVAGERAGDLDDGCATLKILLRRTEQDAIRRALQEAEGDKLAAAARLGISKSSLYAKIEQYGITQAADRAPALPGSRSDVHGPGTRRTR
ncbi:MULTISPECIES: sigma-54-dependent Fis family transcriptional regulator [unclassified Anaeromyxobacter]|uniref:sigma-54 interaction domain-containing protein n=1 Tax=unclassified Anaeromyxobacter TaxID=2620896 RepID=UPI001F591385|nr:MULTISPECIES: sigma 54-interacting transcriptional regulator [unclassified Anaeromyxobacter]